MHFKPITLIPFHSFELTAEILTPDLRAGCLRAAYNIFWRLTDIHEYTAQIVNNVAEDPAYNFPQVPTRKFFQIDPEYMLLWTRTRTDPPYFDLLYNYMQALSAKQSSPSLYFQVIDQALDHIPDKHWDNAPQSEGAHWDKSVHYTAQSILYSLNPGKYTPEFFHEHGSKIPAESLFMHPQYFSSPFRPGERNKL